MSLKYSEVKKILILCAFIANLIPAVAQCDEGEIFVEIQIIPDDWPEEISWEITDADGILYASGESQGDTLCLPGDICATFTIFDSYGDGIINQGGYWVYVDNQIVAEGADYDFVESVVIECPPGQSCITPLDITEGSHTAPEADTWYLFTPEQDGMYLVSTCDLADCDTRIWIYNYCEPSNFDDSNEGTINFDDNDGGCDDLAVINALLVSDISYLIRIGDTNGECIGSIDWSLIFNGQPSGCTDQAACNFQPLAVIDDGSCVYPGDPDCNGPDLTVDQAEIESSMFFDIQIMEEGDCYISEGCVSGYGSRDVLKFGTWIKNIGDIDYYIGPGADAYEGQFEYDECHNHWHYEGWAEYLLFEDDYNLIPIGFKNGFCVMDVLCPDGGTAQFDCSNMGITPGCGDLYHTGLDCQWVDLTDVPDGYYTLVVRVNWDQTPDALGNEEITFDNNWAQVCINITRDTDGDGFLNIEDDDIDGDGIPNSEDDDIDNDGQLNDFDNNERITFEIIEDCPIYVDCMGEDFGTAVVDCNGDCNGIALVGDLNGNGEQEIQDATTYVSEILGDDIEVSGCTDLNSDGQITVTDAAMMAQCQSYNIAHEHPDSSGFHDKCDLPSLEIINPYDSVWFTLEDVNWNQNSIDIHIRNPYNKVVGYQLEFSGIEIIQAVSLVDSEDYPIIPKFALGGNEVIGLSYEDSSIFKSPEYHPLLRLYFIYPESEVCLSSVIDVVNENYHNTVNYIENGCVSQVGIVESLGELGTSITPNPWTESTTLHFENPGRTEHNLAIYNLAGMKLREYSQLRSSSLEILRGDLSAGFYLYRLFGENNSKGAFVIR